MRILVHHADQKVGGVFAAGLGGGLTFRERRHNEGFVPPAVVPGTGVGYFAITFLPQLGFFAAAHQGESSTGHDRNVGAANDFQ